MTRCQSSIVAVLIAVSTLAGCSGRSPDVLAMRIELTALKQELEFLRQQTEELDPRIRSAETMALQVFGERDAPLPLDCAQRVPTVLPTHLAALAVVCDEVQPLAAGQRIRLKIGNPTSARLDGLRLTLFAGEGASQGRSERRLYRATEVALPPGSWRTIELDFDGLDPAAARDLALRAEVGGIQLSSR